MKKINRGFTLIELLIVIAIIGILAGVILVSTSSAQNKAKTAAGKSSMRSALTYIVLCLSDGTATVTTTPTAGNAICSSTAVTDATWPNLGTNCSGATSTAAGVFTATCGTKTITCTGSTGACIET